MAKRRMRLAGAALAILLAGAAAPPLRAQDDEPTKKQITAIRACAEKNQDDLTEAEKQCLFTLVAEPCQNEEGGQSTYGMARCFNIEAKIWDGLLNDNFKSLRAGIDTAQAAKLRDMQRAWIASREETCAFYDTKIHGSMAIFMSAACLARETARRALLLKFFTRL